MGVTEGHRETLRQRDEGGDDPSQTSVFRPQSNYVNAEGRGQVETEGLWWSVTKEQSAAIESPGPVTNECSSGDARTIMT